MHVPSRDRPRRGLVAHGLLGGNLNSPRNLRYALYICFYVLHIPFRLPPYPISGQRRRLVPSISDAVRDQRVPPPVSLSLGRQDQQYLFIVPVVRTAVVFPSFQPQPPIPVPLWAHVSEMAPDAVLRLG